MTTLDACTLVRRDMLNRCVCACADTSRNKNASGTAFARGTLVRVRALTTPGADPKFSRSEEYVVTEVHRRYVKRSRTETTGKALWK